MGERVRVKQGSARSSISYKLNLEMRQRERETRQQEKKAERGNEM